MDWSGDHDMGMNRSLFMSFTTSAAFSSCTAVHTTTPKVAGRETCSLMILLWSLRLAYTVWMDGGFRAGLGTHTHPVTSLPPSPSGPPSSLHRVHSPLLHLSIQLAIHLTGHSTLTVRQGRRGSLSYPVFWSTLRNSSRISLSLFVFAGSKGRTCIMVTVTVSG